MINLQLGLTLSVVGPRANLLTMDEWPMALRIRIAREPPCQGCARIARLQARRVAQKHQRRQRNWQYKTWT